MSGFNITYDDCLKMVSGMKRMPDSPAHFSVYCCNETNICIKMNRKMLIVYYNVRDEYVGREDLLPAAFEDSLVFKIVK